MQSGRFNNRTAIVTGGARGMGASHVRGLAGEGANVVIADVLEQEGKALAEEIGAKAIFVKLDVTDEASWAIAVTEAESAFGPVSVLVNNAAIVRQGLLVDMDPESWRQIIDVNLTGTYLGMRAVVGSMRKATGGSIVNISSTGGMNGLYGLGAYSASKWAVRGLTKTAALEFARDNIRVNSVHPGSVRTPMVAGAVAVGFEEATRNRAVPRPGEPEEITRLVLFLASDEASFSTGSEFIADGGQLLGPVPA